jgi:hypothetical protein
METVVLTDYASCAVVNASARWYHEGAALISDASSCSQFSRKTLRTLWRRWIGRRYSQWSVDAPELSTACRLASLGLEKDLHHDREASGLTKDPKTKLENSASKSAALPKTDIPVPPGQPMH